ncbi:MAG: helix-turn-helix domain-containing protein [Stellaceae bacterium]
MKQDNRISSAAARSRGPSRRQPGKRRANQVDLMVGRRLREARVMAGASPQQLGAALGVSAQSVQKYESGARRMTAARLAAAVKFLGVPMSFLFKEEVAPAVRMEGAGLTPLEIELVLCFRAIVSSELRERVLRVAKAASEEACTAD